MKKKKVVLLLSVGLISLTLGAQKKATEHWDHLFNGKDFKGMLEHSRSSTSEKEPTDINKLADEYLRLCYHGLRAKDQFFNVTMQTDYDQSIEKINIIPQDIGRVLLNLYNNAFYAVNERKKHQPEGYELAVTIATKRIGDKIEVKSCG